MLRNSFWKAALAVALILASGGAWAQVSAVPERRAVAEPETDFFGGDIRSIYGTSLDLCARICLDEAACSAFTFNTRNNACFLKETITERVPFAGAVSAAMVPASPEALARTAARAADLGFLPAERLDAARAQAQAVGLSHPPAGRGLEALAAAAAAAETAGDRSAALAAALAAVNVEDVSGTWLAAARLAQGIEQEAELGWQELRERPVLLAVNAYLRAADAGEQATAAGVLAAALETVGEGRRSLDAWRLADRLAPTAETAAAVTRAEGLFGFRVLDLFVDSEPASPRACWSFSEDLAAAGVDYGDFVRMEGTALPVEAEGSALCVDGLEHGRSYGFALRAGLPAASGEELRRTVEQEVYVRDRSPAVRFLGRAYVLPRSAGAAIPVSSVNVSEVALRIHRVGERNVAAVLRGGQLGGALTGFDETTLAAQTGELVWEGTGEIVPELNRDVVTALPVGEAVAGLEPGLYAMTARVPGALREDYENLATQWFVVTDLGLASLSGADGLNVFVRALSSAEAVAGVEVRLVARNNEVLGTTASDADGRARFDPGLLRGRGGAEAALVTAELGDDFAFLSLTEPPFDLSDRGVEGRAAPPPVDVFVTTERGAYRPGETVHATILTRDARAAAVEGLPLTAIVTRPDGVEHTREVLADAGAGGRVMALALDERAQRGTWRMRLHADPEAPALANASWLVEDFVPERIDFTPILPEGPVAAGARPVLEVAARYLWGAQGAGLAVEGEVTLAPGRELPGFGGYVFGLEDEPFRSGFASLPRGLVTDAEGRLAIPLPIPEAAAFTRPMTLTAVLRMAEGSGRPVERELSRPLAPAAPLIGIRPLFDGAVDEGGSAGFEMIGVGEDLTRVALGPVDWVLNRVETSYQWYEIGGNWNYEPVTRRTRVASGAVEIGVGAPARLDLLVDWGRYELRLDGGGTAASLGFSAGWYPATAGAETPDVLEASLDRAEYAPGGTARLRVVAREAGQLLVSVLSDRLVDFRELAVEAGETVVELPVTDDWGAGAYVSATLVRPMDVAARRNPARAIGIAWAPVDPGEKRLEAVFEGPERAAPRGPLEAVLRVDGAGAGETIWATIAAVDVGILNLTGFAAPDPEGHYFGQRKLGVELRDVYGRLIDGMQGVPGRVRSGGDGGSPGFRAPPPTEELVAFFAGPLQVDGEGRVRAVFDLPDFNGTVRLMAVVWSVTGVGQAERDVLVRDPVVVSASLPRFLAPGDATRLRLELAHAEGPAGPVALRVAGPGVVEALETEVALAEGGRRVVDVPLSGGDPGDYRVVVTAVTPGGAVLEKVLTVAVRANDPELARQDRVTLAPGESLVLDAAVFDGLRPGTARATLAAGPLADFDVPGLLTALDAYPWGCTEQIAARAMALLYFDTMAAGMGIGGDLPERIAEAIRGVLANQTGAGGFGLWRPEGGDLWLDAFATDFLSRARALGHAVPDPAFRSALGNLRNAANTYGDFEAGGEDLAYALMVLAREGQASIGDLRYYADRRAENFATPFAQAQLGLALASYGEQARADRLFRLASANAAAGEAETLWRADYGSGLRDAAGVLALAAEAGSAAVDRAALTGIVTAPGAVRSTQESLWSLLAAHALMAEAQGGTVTVNGAPAERPVVRMLDDPAALPVTVANTGDAATEVVVTAFGVPSQPEPAQGNGYRIARSYYTLDGAPADLGAVPQDARLVAVVTVTPERDQEARLIVDDPLPAGFEIDNPNLLRSGDPGQLAWLQADDVATIAEFGAERFVAAVDWQGAEPFRLAYLVRAVSPGSFHHPAASVEDMYRPAYRARTDAGRVEVTGGTP
jgi:uncharacterized protein YfaS (alpha-2-macroglobulin family)